MFGKQVKPAPEPAEDNRELDELERVYAHKYLRLLELRTPAGNPAFHPDDVLHLLRNPRLDWHEAEKLLASGCSPALVIRLLEE